MTDGSVAGFKYFRFEGETKIQVMTRGKGRGRIGLRTALDREVIGGIAIEPSEEWQLSSVENLAIQEGVQALYFTYVGDGYMDFKQFILLNG